MENMYHQSKRQTRLVGFRQKEAAAHIRKDEPVKVTPFPSCQLINNNSLAMMLPST